MKTVSTILLTTALLLLTKHTASNEEQWVRVVDQNGAPVEDAIVSFIADNTSAASIDTRNMGQVNMQFSPKVLIVPMGQKVLFPNSDSTRHHVYSFSKPKPFEIKLYKGVPNEPLIFDTPGMVVLGCNIHDSMVGYIYVTDQEVARLTSKEGVSQFEGDLPNSVQVWHYDNTLGDRGKSEVELTQDTQNNTWIATINIRQAVKTKTNTFKSKFGK